MVDKKVISISDYIFYNTTDEKLEKIYSEQTPSTIKDNNIEFNIDLSERCNEINRDYKLFKCGNKTVDGEINQEYLISKTSFYLKDNEVFLKQMEKTLQNEPELVYTSIIKQCKKRRLNLKSILSDLNFNYQD